MSNTFECAAECQELAMNACTFDECAAWGDCSICAHKGECTDCEDAQNYRKNNSGEN